MFRLLIGVLVAIAASAAGGPARAQRPGPTPAQRPGTPPATPPVGRPVTLLSNWDWEKKLALGLEIGPGAVISSFSRDNGPSSILFLTGVRATADLVPMWSAQLALRHWWLPDNRATVLAPGVRFEPVLVPAGRVFVDGSLGLVLTENNFTWGLDLGGGLEWDIPDSPGFSMGPYFRYGYVMNPDDRSSRDGHAWSVGLSANYHFGRAAAAPRGVTPVRTTGGRYRVTIPDTDRDGIGDDRDECRQVPVGKHPDPYKVGCPENDEDGDDVPDSADACPVVPPGANPDPNRPGCPIVDTDKDGIPDYLDACPGKAGPGSAERAHNGCPDKTQKRPAAEETPATPVPEASPIPKTVHKRKLK